MPGVKKHPYPYAPYILVVDDDDQVRRLFSRMLEAAGYLVAVAENGAAAVRQCNERFFDVIVCDLSMPDMDGFELLRFVRQELPDIKVVMTSGFMGGSLLPAARKLGADAMLHKPSDLDRLLTAVCGVLS